MQVFVWTYVFIWVIYVRVELLGYNGNSMFNGLRTCQTVFQQVHHFGFPQAGYKALISSHPRRHLLLSFFEYHHPRYEMIFCCGSDLHLLRNGIAKLEKKLQANFHAYLLWEMSCSDSFCPFKKRSCFFN